MISQGKNKFMPVTYQAVLNRSQKYNSVKKIKINHLNFCKDVYLLRTILVDLVEYIKICKMLSCLL